MKVIKFRLKLDGKIVGYEEHIMMGNHIVIRQRKEGESMWWIPNLESGFIICNQKEQYTGYGDWDFVDIYDGDVVEIESGTSFSGGKHGDKTLHRIEWCDDYGSWVMIGLDQFGRNKKPSKNALNDNWTNKTKITAQCHPLRVVKRDGQCKYCKDFKLMLLDEDGILSGISGKPGRWAHAYGDGHWGCGNPPTADPDPLPYLFAKEMIEQGLASECDDDDCEGRLVIDGVCTYCGKEYPLPEVPNHDQIGIDDE